MQSVKYQDKLLNNTNLILTKISINKKTKHLNKQIQINSNLNLLTESNPLHFNIFFTFLHFFHLLNSEWKLYAPGPGIFGPTLIVFLGFLSKTNDFSVLFFDNICFPVDFISVLYVNGPKIGVSFGFIDFDVDYEILNDILERYFDM